jgi:shikimate dehydrogenase
LTELRALTASHPDRFLLAGVMGDPVMHSRSPLLHGYWLAKYGLTGAYLPLAIKPAGLRAALRALPALGFAGCNLTIPHKEAALDIVDRVDPVARRIGAMNCVVVAADGSLDGYNYDAFGYIESVREMQPGWRADTGPIVVIGAGGSARAIVVGLIDEGARDVRVVNRTLARAQALAREFGGAVSAVPWDERTRALNGAAMLINTTNQGMNGEPALDLALDALPVSALVSDIIYIPRETPLLAAARARGNPAVNGLGMLIHQARPAFEAWFGIKPEATAELRERIEATT